MSSPTHKPDTIVILAAGQGTRMRSTRPKVLHELCGRSMLAYVLDLAFAMEPSRVIVVVGHGAEDVAKNVEAEGFGERVTLVHQTEQLGTGHALQVCLPELGSDPGRVVVLYGDMPLIQVETLTELCAVHSQSSNAKGEGAAILTAEPMNPRGFGRILRDSAGGAVTAIVEEKDATSEQRAIREVNLGVYTFPGKELVEILPKLSNENAQGEYYLTDVIGALRSMGRDVLAHVMEDESEGIGVNNLRHLSEARRALQDRILDMHMNNGVRIEDPDTTYIDWHVTIGSGTTILPCTVIRNGVTVGEHCEVGPFTHLRVGTVLKDGAEIGNFCESKKSTLGSHTKAKHLTYLGDTTVGERSNIGAGTIFANYDGTHKHKSVVGDRAFVGSGTILVAPGHVGNGATTGAGAVVTRDVPEGEVWIGVPAKPLRSASKNAASVDDSAQTKEQSA